MMREIASKGIFESKCGSGEKEAIWHNIAVKFELLRRTCCNGAKS